MSGRASGHGTTFSAALLGKSGVDVGQHLARGLAAAVARAGFPAVRAAVLVALDKVSDAGDERGQDGRDDHHVDDAHVRHSPSRTNRTFKKSS